MPSDGAAQGAACPPQQGFRATLLFSLIGFLISFGFSLLTPVLPLYALSFDVSLAMVGLLVASIGIAKVLLDIPARGSSPTGWGPNGSCLLDWAR